ncbi:MAG TPA: hypothetical protein VGJ73_06135 [Verrucomicrobiae bacterium]
MEPKETEADSVESGNGISSQASSSHWRDICIVLIVSWAVRMAFVCMMPIGARSFDAYTWGHQADLLKSGVNPYMANEFFSWPPFWMQVVFVISKISDFLNVPFFRILQLSLILVESAVIVQVMRLIQRIAPAANARAIVMIGIALNPAAVFLVCQHCNFDVLMAFWVLLAAASLLRYNASDDLIDWLCACLFLGLGILTKTVPLALIPLLAGGFRKATASGRLLGTTLVLGPTALGMSIIYALGPSGGMHVLKYRATNGIYFGFPGFLHAMGMDEFSRCFDDAFYIFGIGIMALTWRHLWQHRSLRDRETILYIAVILLAIPGLGPGLGSQYFYWFIPFFVISYALFSGLWRKVLIGFAIVAAITFILDYGLDRAYGYNFLYIMSQASTPDELHHWSMITTNSFCIDTIDWERWLELPANETLERIPLFIAILTVIVFGARILILNLQEIRKWVIAFAGIYLICVALVFATALGTKCFWPGTHTNSNPTSSQPAQNAAQH